MYSHREGDRVDEQISTTELDNQEESESETWVGSIDRKFQSIEEGGRVQVVARVIAISESILIIE